MEISILLSFIISLIAFFAEVFHDKRKWIIFFSGLFLCFSSISLFSEIREFLNSGAPLWKRIKHGVLKTLFGKAFLRKQIEEKIKGNPIFCNPFTEKESNCMHDTQHYLSFIDDENSQPINTSALDFDLEIQTELDKNYNVVLGSPHIPLCLNKTSMFPTGFSSFKVTRVSFFIGDYFLSVTVDKNTKETFLRVKNSKYVTSYTSKKFKFVEENVMDYLRYHQIVKKYDRKCCYIIDHLKPKESNKVKNLRYLHNWNIMDVFEGFMVGKKLFRKTVSEENKMLLGMFNDSFTSDILLEVSNGFGVAKYGEKTWNCIKEMSKKYEDNSQINSADGQAIDKKKSDYLISKICKMESSRNVNKVFSNWQWKRFLVDFSYIRTSIGMPCLYGIDKLISPSRYVIELVKRHCLNENDKGVNIVHELKINMDKKSESLSYLDDLNYEINGPKKNLKPGNLAKLKELRSKIKSGLTKGESSFMEKRRDNIVISTGCFLDNECDLTDPDLIRKKVIYRNKIRETKQIIKNLNSTQGVYKNALLKENTKRLDCFRGEHKKEVRSTTISKFVNSGMLKKDASIHINSGLKLMKEKFLELSKFDENELSKIKNVLEIEPKCDNKNGDKNGCETGVVGSCRKIRRFRRSMKSKEIKDKEKFESLNKELKGQNESIGETSSGNLSQNVALKEILKKNYFYELSKDDIKSKRRDISSSIGKNTSLVLNSISESSVGPSNFLAKEGFTDSGSVNFKDLLSKTKEKRIINTNKGYGTIIKKVLKIQNLVGVSIKKQAVKGSYYSSLNRIKKIRDKDKSMETIMKEMIEKMKIGSRKDNKLKRKVEAPKEDVKEAFKRKKKKGFLTSEQNSSIKESNTKIKNKLEEAKKIMRLGLGFIPDVNDNQIFYIRRDKVLTEDCGKKYYELFLAVNRFREEKYTDGLLNNLSYIDIQDPEKLMKIVNSYKAEYKGVSEVNKEVKPEKVRIDIKPSQTQQKQQKGQKMSKAEKKALHKELRKVKKEKRREEKMLESDSSSDNEYIEF